MPSRRIRELLWWTGHFENDLANWSGWRSLLALLFAAAPARLMLYVSLGLYKIAERIGKCRAFGGD
jgi:hypothetical protein